MESKQCGECKLDVHDLEPVCCGFCETFYHIRPQCCGFNQRSCKDIFAQGKAMFICANCRIELNGRSIRAYIADVNKNIPPPPSHSDALSVQVQQLSGLVEVLSQKVDNFVCGTDSSAAVREPNTPQWPRLGAKRRRREPVQIQLPYSDRGTKSVDLSDLSVPFITPAVSAPKFWLYLSGFQPLVTTEDMRKIIERCLEVAAPMDIVRLTPKDKDVSTLTFISFKIGLDPALKDKSLDAASWPIGVRFREFIDRSKNSDQ